MKLNENNPIFAPKVQSIKTTCYKKMSSKNLTFIEHSYNARYTFASKERDEESGLSYFGARYYSSDLSIWLSVDPMSDKYPSLSPYVYCANNPVKLVDPNGKDEWDLEKDGTLSQRANGRTDIDIVHAKDKSGNDIERKYKVGSININAQCKERYDQRVGWYTTDDMEFNDSEIATDFFEFAAENTDVEWALKIAPEQSIVGTSHDQGFVSIRSPEGMTDDIHSHTDDPCHYIGSDNSLAYNSYTKGINFKVYLQGQGLYATYNASTMSLDKREFSKTFIDNFNLIKSVLLIK